MSAGETITELLADVAHGDAIARSRLAELVYDDLHRIASHHMRNERPDHTLQATALVNEAYIHLIKETDRSWHNRSHFFAVAARIMRQILTDHARGRNAAKRGSGVVILHLDEVAALAEGRCEELLAVDQALARLAERDVRLSEIVEMKFFAGLTDEETAEALGISSRTVKREWRVAKAWLQGNLFIHQGNDAQSVGKS